MAARNTTKPSSNTVQARNYDLKAIANHINNDGDLETLTGDDLTVPAMETGISVYLRVNACSELNPPSHVDLETVLSLDGPGKPVDQQPARLEFS